MLRGLVADISLNRTRQDETGLLDGLKPGKLLVLLC